MFYKGRVVIGAIFAACGLLAASVLVGLSDAAKVSVAIMRVGWGIAAIVAVRAVIIASAGFAWSLIVRPLTGQDLSLFVLLRWIREAINVLLPVASVGGDLIGARLLSFSGVPGGLAAASILVDLLIQTSSGLVFAVAGLGFLAAEGHKGVIAGWLLAALMVSATAVACFYLAQRAGFFNLFERGMRAAARWTKRSFRSDWNLHDNLQRIYADHRAILGAFLVHLMVWLLGAVEIWIALKCMGNRPGIVEPMVLESLSQAARASAFPVPGALGVQEAAFLLLGQAYGISAQTALALSLVKRVPDVVLGLPGLFMWHLVEARRVALQPEPASVNEAGTRRKTRLFSFRRTDRQ